MAGAIAASAQEQQTQTPRAASSEVPEQVLVTGSWTRDDEHELVARGAVTVSEGVDRGADTSAARGVGVRDVDDAHSGPAHDDVVRGLVVEA